MHRLLAIALLVGGCGTSIRYTSLQQGRTFRRRPASSVEIFLSAPPDCPHRDVGLFEAEQESEFSVDETKEMLVKLQEKAGQHGCDAIFVKGVGSHSETNVVLDITTSTKTLTATCIEYLDSN